MKKLFLFLVACIFCFDVGQGEGITSTMRGVLTVSGNSYANADSFFSGPDFKFNVLNGCTGSVWATVYVYVSIDGNTFNGNVFLPPHSSSESISFEGESSSYSTLLTMSVSYTGYTGKESLACHLQYSYTSIGNESVLEPVE